jgi:hypothetical protein
MELAVEAFARQANGGLIVLPDFNTIALRHDGKEWRRDKITIYGPKDDGTWPWPHRSSARLTAVRSSNSAARPCRRVRASWSCHWHPTTPYLAGASQHW